MASPPSPDDNNYSFKLLPPLFHSSVAQKLALEDSSLAVPNNVTNDLHDFQTSIIVCFVGIMLFVFFYQILDRFYNWLQNETFEQDIESGGIANNHRSLAGNPDWSHEAAALNNLWLQEIFNGFMAFLADRQGLSPEDLEQALPIVKYKSLGKALDKCVICLEVFEDDELCRVFPVCEHVFHFNCIDIWLRNHITCPICRNCIVDV